MVLRAPKLDQSAPGRPFIRRPAHRHCVEVTVEAQLRFSNGWPTVRGNVASVFRWNLRGSQKDRLILCLGSARDRRMTQRGRGRSASSSVSSIVVALNIILHWLGCRLGRCFGCQTPLRRCRDVHLASVAVVVGQIRRHEHATIGHCRAWLLRATKVCRCSRHRSVAEAKGRIGRVAVSFVYG